MKAFERRLEAGVALLLRVARRHGQARAAARIAEEEFD
jgi:hypothetical protein